jgi:hypothetical protein
MTREMSDCVSKSPIGGRTAAMRRPCLLSFVVLSRKAGVGDDGEMKDGGWADGSSGLDVCAQSDRGPTAACLSSARFGQGVYVLSLLLSCSLLHAYEADFRLPRGIP